jgi:two-component system sensor histidine kinase RegB
LAAAAAHELGTPLGTIAVVARELARDLPPDSPLREDAEILIAETARCREILAELAARPESDAGEPFNLLPVSVLAKAAAEPFRRPGIDLEVTCEGMQPEPRIRRSPELLHGLGTLLQNAIQFAAGRVDVRIAWDAAELSVTIRDDGPGFDPRILEELGRPYLSTRRFAKKQEEWEGEVHMGLGVFIAQALLGRTGARLDFTNAPRGGAQVAIRWRRPILEGETAAAAS